MSKSWIVLLCAILLTACVNQKISQSNRITPFRTFTVQTETTVTPSSSSSATNTPTSASSKTANKFSAQTSTQIPSTHTVVPTLQMVTDPLISVTINRQWKKQIRNFDGVSMALVPTGCFPMGSEQGYPIEAPVHQICIETPFWIDLTEVTNEQFAKFLNEIEKPIDPYDVWFGLRDDAEPEIILHHGSWIPLIGLGKDPVHAINWHGAAAFCQWRGTRLPNEAEWEFAARGPDGLIYPWGNELVEANVVRIFQLVPDYKIPHVGSKPQGASWVGALDMSSSLFEWVHTIYRPYPYDPADGRESTITEDPTSERVLRSGSWYHNVADYHLNDNITTSARYRSAPGNVHWSYGFRCVRDYLR